jgi:hypothetical protein
MFTGKLEKTSTLEINGMTFEVGRITNYIRSKLSEIDNSDDSIADKSKKRLDLYAKELVKGWSNVSEDRLADVIVSDNTHSDVNTFDVNGHSVDINRANFDDVFKLIDNSDDVYKNKASLAIDVFLATKDAMIDYNGEVVAMNESIRNEIKESDEWEDVVDAIIEMAFSYYEYKDDLSNLDIEFSDELVDKYLVGAHISTKKVHLLDSIYKHANGRENFRTKRMIEEAETAKK